MKSILKNIVAFFLLVVFAASVSSCNRGYGCPNNFQMDVAAKTLQTATQTVLPR